MAAVGRWLFVLCLPVLIITATIGWAFNSLWLYKTGFARYGVAQTIGLPSSELDRAAGELINYFNSGQELVSITVVFNGGPAEPLFDEADTAHLRDVKALVWLDYRLFIGSAAYCLVFAGVSLLWRRRRSLALGAAWGGGLTVALLSVFGVLAVTSFDWFFTTFHRLFFPQGNWQFPAGDRMITLFPWSFWNDVTLLVGAVSLALALLALGLGLAYLRRTRQEIRRDTAT